MLIATKPAAADTAPTTVSNLMSVLREDKQKAAYNVNLNAPFGKESCGINENISTETGELSILQTILDLPGRNGMDLVLQAEYRNRDAKLFNETTRSAAVPISYGQTVVAYYDVFDQNGYWLKTGALEYTNCDSVLAEWQYNQERWVFNGYLSYDAGGTVTAAAGIYNAAQERSKALTGRYLLGEGWAIDLPYLDIEGDSVFVRLQDGSVYKADFNPANGLEKYELTDLLFARYTDFSYGNETAAYRLYFKDGDEFFFSADGFLIGQRDSHRNTIRYYYGDVSGIKALTMVEDSVGRTVKIGYNDTATVISSGSKQVTLMKRPIPGQSSKHYLAGFIDAEGREVKYQYSFDAAEFDMAGGKPPAFNNYANLVEIQYPTGARTIYSYVRGRKNIGQSGSMEYFKVRERYDQDGDRILNRLTYRYANEPDGYPTYKADQVPDNYRYETFALNSKNLTVGYTFDGRHLPVTTRVTGKRLMAQTDTGYHERYKLPVRVRERVFNETGNAMEKVDLYDYDSRGNVIVENHPTKRSEYTSSERKVFYTYDFRYNLLVSARYKQNADTTVEKKMALTRDGKEVASEAIYANGRLMSRQSYRYDGYGNVLSATARKTSSEDVTTNFEYGPEYGYAYLTKKSVASKDADGNKSVVTVHTGYDFATGNITSETDGNGNVTRFKYDLVDRLLEKTNPDKTAQTYEYDDSKNIAYVTDENKNQIIYYFDGLGKLTRAVDKKQNIDLVNIKYDDQYNVLQEINPNRNYVEYSYDQANRLIKVGHRDSRGEKLAETGVQYDEAFQDRSGTVMKITVTKESGKGRKDLVVNYYYDARERLVKQGRVQDGKEYSASNTYDYLDNLIEETDYKDNRTKYTLDGLGRLIKRTNALGKSRKYEYDYLGNQVAATDELGNTARVEYDALGRVIVKKAPFEPEKESVIRNYYDAAGNLIRTVDPEGYTTRYRYNECNLLTVTEKVMGAGKSEFTKYEYDAVGKCTKVASGISAIFGPAGAETHFEYDSLGRIIAYTDPSGKKETYRYDAGGNLLALTDRNGKTYDYEYDGLDRLTKKQIVFEGRRETVEYSYDFLGNRTQMKDAGGLTRYEYDSLSRLNKIRQDNGISLAYAYDILDRRVGMTLSRSSDKLMDVKYSYNNLGLLTQVREQGRAVSYRYDAANRLTAAINEVTGVTTDYRYNPGGMLTSLVNQKGGEVLSSYKYSYDRRGNQTRKVDKNGTSRYYYDALSRLKTAVLPDNLTQNYTYDNLGNLTELAENHDGRVKETLYKYNRNSELLLQEETEGDETTRSLFRYDHNGNQTEKNKLIYRDGKLVASQNSNYRFDDWNQLREAVTPDGKRVFYEYNGNGLRTSKDVDGEITNFAYDGGNPILETDESGLPKARNFYGLDLVSRQTADHIYYYLFNGHGDVTQLLDKRGEIVKDYEYDPFGKELNNEPQLVPGKPFATLWRAEVEQLDNPFRYAGEYLDQETGYYYLKARYYDPQIQRFISADSLAKNPSWKQHAYAYCGYNPINFIDPSGHISIGTIVGGIIGGIIGGTIGGPAGGVIGGIVGALTGAGVSAAASSSGSGGSSGNRSGSISIASTTRSPYSFAAFNMGRHYRDAKNYYGAYKDFRGAVDKLIEAIIASPNGVAATRPAQREFWTRIADGFNKIDWKISEILVREALSDWPRSFKWGNSTWQAQEVALDPTFLAFHNRICEKYLSKREGPILPDTVDKNLFFPQSGNPDLWFGLHLITETHINATRDNKTRMWTVNYKLMDEFDFTELINPLKKVGIGIIGWTGNDLGYISTACGVLHSVPVEIDITSYYQQRW
ncbi:MAG: RHS repeat-associated core domain-containing protein [Bacillota bacterium]